VATILRRFLVRADYCVFGGPPYIWLAKNLEVNKDLQAVDPESGAVSMWNVSETSSLSLVAAGASWPFGRSRHKQDHMHRRRLGFWV